MACGRLSAFLRRQADNFPLQPLFGCCGGRGRLVLSGAATVGERITLALGQLFIRATVVVTSTVAAAAAAHHLLLCCLGTSGRHFIGAWCAEYSSVRLLGGALRLRLRVALRRGGQAAERVALRLPCRLGQQW